MHNSRLKTGLWVVLIVLFVALVLPVSAQQDLTAEIKVLTGQPVGRIDPDVYGLFTEMCYYEFNGGMWAEMLKSRKFAEEDGGSGHGVVRPWSAMGRTDSGYFLHDNTVYYTGIQSQKIVSEDGANKRTGIGQKGLFFQANADYLVRLNLKQEALGGPVTVALEGNSGVYAETQFAVSGGDWQRFSLVLRSTKSDKNGSLTITFPGKGSLWVGTASLMPGDNMGGFRKDVVLALKALNLPSVRWPGGNMVSEYQWTDGIGDRDKRPPRFIRELWEPNDVGIDEFMELCRLINTRASRHGLSRLIA